MNSYSYNISVPPQSSYTVELPHGLGKVPSAIVYDSGTDWIGGSFANGANINSGYVTTKNWHPTGTYYTTVRLDYW